MKLSEKSKSKLYDAIGDEIMTLRSKIERQDNELSYLMIDKDLFNLTEKIYSRIKEDLNIKE